MELQQINQRIAVVNSESKRLNNERQVLIGKRQTLEQQLSDLLATYEKDYGVKLTIDTIEAEVARVSALKEEEVSGVEMMLDLIKAGRYEEAERIASGAVDSHGIPVEPAQTAVPAQQTATVADDGAVKAERVEDETPIPASNPPVGDVPPAPPPQQSAGAPVPPDPVGKPPAPPTFAPPAPPVFAPPAEVAPPSPPAGQSAVAQDDRPAPPPPIQKPTAPLGTPKIGVPPAVGVPNQSGPMSFQAVLGGQAFNPQEGG